MTRVGRREGGHRWLALPLALAIASTVSAVIRPIPIVGQEVRWTGSVSYASGSYVFDARTHTVAFSNGLGITWGSVDLSATLPLLLQNSQLVSQVGGVPLPTGGTDHAVVGGRGPGDTVGTRSGGGQTGGGGSGSQTTVVYADRFEAEVGDPLVSLGARLYEGTGPVRSLQAYGSAKAPIRGLDSGVGTGEWDLGVGVSALASLTTHTFAFVDVAYWRYGDLPELELSDGLSYGVGVSRSVLDGRGSLMASFFGAQAVIPVVDSPASLGLGATYSLRPGRNLSAGMALGLTESSPDLSVYVGWTVSLG